MTTTATAADGGGDGGKLTVLAAASLTDVFEELADDFEEEHDVDVEFSFGSSTDLAEQVADGAPGDVLATADETSMQRRRGRRRHRRRRDLRDQRADDRHARRTTRPASSRSTTSTAPRGCAAPTRCRAARSRSPCSTANGITAEPASLEEDVRATLDKVVSGEADAGLVYATDAVAAGDDVDAVEIPGAEDELTSYFVTTLEQSEDADLAADWVDLVTSRGGSGDPRATPASAAREGPARAGPPALLLVPAVLRRAAPARPAGGDGRQHRLAGTARPPHARRRCATRSGSRLVTSTVAIVFCLLLGLPLAWLLARVDFRGRGAAPGAGHRAAGAAAGRRRRRAAQRLRPHRASSASPLLDWTGFAFPFTTYGVVLAHIFVSMPFVVITIEGALRSADPRYDAAAATLGATRWTTFRRVTVPLALPGVVAGMVLGWARSLGEFGATITFTGNYPGTTQTMPTLIYVTRQADQDAALALSLVMLLVSDRRAAAAARPLAGDAVSAARLDGCDLPGRRPGRRRVHRRARRGGRGDRPQRRRQVSLLRAARRARRRSRAARASAAPTC